MLLQLYWTDELQAFHNMAAADGIWIDMNEVQFAVTCFLLCFDFERCDI